MSENIVEIKDLTFSYPDGTVALVNINLSLEKGTITGGCPIKGLVLNIGYVF
jgi:ABC-type Mn2+/Zn2+ transport system ATPase subunit